MDNNQRTNTEIINLQKNKQFLNAFINTFYNLRNHFYFLLKDFYCNDKKGIEHNFNKINGLLKYIEKITSQYKVFYENTIQRLPNFTIQKEDISNFFKGEQLFNKTILNSYSGFWKLLIFGNVYIDFFKEISKKKFVTQIDYLNYEFQSKVKEIQKKIVKEKDETCYTEININPNNLNINDIIKEYFKDIMTIKFLNSNPNDKCTKILISIKNLFNIVLYDDSKNIKILLGGKKEHYSFYKNRYSFFKLKKFYLSETSSKFIIYAKLKKFLIQRLQSLNLEMIDYKNHYIKILYFLKIISYYSNLFKQECGLCNKILKFNLIDKLFYPPLIYYNEYSHNNILNEKIIFFHEDCYSLYINQ